MIKSPYPYFGGKSSIAPIIWHRLGNVRNFVDPFFGSGAVLLSRPDFDPAVHIETVNDLDGMIANFWRAVSADAQTVAKYADWPANENDLHARHAWLVGQKASLQTQLEGDPAFYDAKIAGWWVWGMALWIGGGFCGGNGPWQQIDGKLLHVADNGRGVKRRLLHVGNNGQGINRRLIHVQNTGKGTQRMSLSAANNGLYAYFDELQARLKRVRVCSGDWTRVVTPSVTTQHGLTGIILDPPYTHVGRATDIYNHESADIAAQVREWAIANGDNPLLRIAYCGYDEPGVTFPASWETYQWRAKKGYGGQGVGNENRERERIWFSPHCVKPVRSVMQLSLFSFAEA